MRLVVQRVKRASVLVARTGEVVGKIRNGLFVLVGVKVSDTKKDAEILAEKLVKLRIMADKAGKMNLSVKDLNAPLLVVSQFTLYADTSKGNRPSFVKAARPELAQEIYEHFIGQLKKEGIRVESGKFGDYMEISALLDGPVTISL